jgi:hypothetical protein
MLIVLARRHVRHPVPLSPARRARLPECLHRGAGLQRRTGNSGLHSVPLCRRLSKPRHRRGRPMPRPRSSPAWRCPTSSFSGNTTPGSRPLWTMGFARRGTTSWYSSTETQSLSLTPSARWWQRSETQTSGQWQATQRWATGGACSGAGSTSSTSWDLTSTGACLTCCNACPPLCDWCLPA